MNVKRQGLRNQWPAVVVAGVLVAAFALPAAAQSGGGYDLSWNVIAGGGGKIRDGTGLYSVKGTIGQPAVGTMTGGAYSLTGGFWALPPGIPGDVNSDGRVDVSDLLWTAWSWGLSPGQPGYNRACDINDDDSVDVADLLILAAYWGQ
jgi:hypothetical protein